MVGLERPAEAGHHEAGYFLRIVCCPDSGGYFPELFAEGFGFLPCGLAACHLVDQCGGPVDQFPGRRRLGDAVVDAGGTHGCELSRIVQVHHHQDRRGRFHGGERGVDNHHGGLA